MTAVDWDAKPEPWRSIGKAWAVQVKDIMRGYVPGQRVSKQPGDRLRDFRHERGFTQSGLAVLAGYNVKLISQLETGKNKTPRPQTRLDIAQALGVDPSEIWR